MYYQRSFYCDFHQIEFHFSPENTKIEIQLFFYCHLGNRSIWWKITSSKGNIMDSISPSFFYEYSFAIHFASAAIAAASSFVVIKLANLIAHAYKSTAAKLRSVDLGGMRSVGRVAVSQWSVTAVANRTSGRKGRDFVGFIDDETQRLFQCFKPVSSR